MAICRKVIRQWAGGLLTAAFLFFSYMGNAFAAAPPAPTLTDTPWYTGQIQVCYTGAIPGDTVRFYTKTYANPNWTLTASWVAAASSECQMVEPFQNGQTVFQQLTQVDAATGIESVPSVEGRQTPPITAYIINWPQMLTDIKSALQDVVNQINNHLDQLFTPSQTAMNNLNQAVQNLQNAVGAGSAASAGSELQNGLNGVASNLTPPGIQNDGTTTYTGGTGGLKLPQGSMTLTPPNSNGGMLGNLQSVNCDDGTNTPLTIEIPIGVKQDGSLFKCKIGTQEQFDKFPWLRLLRDLASAALWILFGVWLVQRFSPQFKT